MNYSSFSIIPELKSNLLSDRFAQIDELFSRMTGAKPISDMPAYNLLQKEKEKLELTVSVPGYQQHELDISILNNKLTISGKSEAEKEKVNNDNNNEKWLHKGIEKKEFSMNFDLGHRIIVEDANLADGLLTVNLQYEIPEEEKPQKIAISPQLQLNKSIEHQAA